MAALFIFLLVIFVLRCGAFGIGKMSLGVTTLGFVPDVDAADGSAVLDVEGADGGDSSAVTDVKGADEVGVDVSAVLVESTDGVSVDGSTLLVEGTGDSVWMQGSGRSVRSDGR